MAYIHNPDRGAADLVLLAAQDFTAEPVARIHLPARIPSGFTFLLMAARTAPRCQVLRGMAKRVPHVTDTSPPWKERDQ